MGTAVGLPGARSPFGCWEGPIKPSGSKGLILGGVAKLPASQGLSDVILESNFWEDPPVGHLEQFPDRPSCPSTPLRVRATWGRRSLWGPGSCRQVARPPIAGLTPALCPSCWQPGGERGGRRLVSW